MFDGWEESTAECVASQMCALRDYVAMRRFKIYSSVLSSSASLRKTGRTHHTSSSAHQTSGPTHYSSGSTHHTSSSTHHASDSTHQSSLNRNLIQEATHTSSSDHTHKSVVPSRSVSTSLSQRSSVSESVSFGSVSPVSRASQLSNVDHGGSVKAESRDGKEGIAALDAQTEGQVNSEDLLEENRNERLVLPAPSAMNTSPPSAAGGKDAHYLEKIPGLCDKLIAADKEVQQDGWVSLGMNKEVAIMKKPPGKGEVLGSFKGTGMINAPPEFLLRLLEDPDRASELDEQLKEARVISEVTSNLHLVQLLYKPVWPTAARDFCMLSASGYLAEDVWVSAAMSVEDGRVPAEKGYVRGHLEFGGYVIRSVPNMTEQSLVTYIGSVDLKGNIPAFVTNKVSESQPLCVSMLRKIGETLYHKLKSQPQKLREMEGKFPIMSVLLGNQDKSADIVGSDKEPEVASVRTEEVKETTSDQTTLPLSERLKQSQWHFDPAPLSPESRENDLTSTILLEEPPQGLVEHSPDGFVEKDKATGRLVTQDSSTGKFGIPEESEDEELDTVLSSDSSPLPIELDAVETDEGAAAKSMGEVNDNMASGKRRTHSDSQLGNNPSSPRMTNGVKVRANSLRQEHSSPSLVRRLKNGRSSDSVRVSLH